ncbi:SRPBCC domain-containing protein [Paenibacillus filicis]|uniref:SRPBCC domain-containing protein n=1 Tax=Paenibacillus gyeongsangnamensis TaxID=3388067 RepID=A0ABT4QB29_9BACL|nr:SRPBCC domain-containing protein [Paenibacillus filicis]MCZ8513981.1 SRPBCC domain-containing protein [Paenibacillus filicis]
MELKYEFYIDGTPEQVWDALVSDEGTRKIFFNCVFQSSLKEGEPFAYIGPGAEGDETVHVYGTILTCVPGKEMSCIEHPGPSYHANHEELTSRIMYTLDTVGSCTKLTLINDQYSDNHPSFENARNSWWMILSNVKTYVETGKTLDFGW